METRQRTGGGMMDRTAQPPAVEVRDVHDAWGGRRADRTVALRGTSFVVSAGSYVALLGPNGSGKSTLFTLLVGLRTPRSGLVSIFGCDPLEVRRRIGMVFQHPALDPHLSVRENLMLQAGLFGFRADDREARIRSRAEALDLTTLMSRRVGTLSGGERRRCDLARALLHDPDLLLLDEATVGLDPAARAHFLSAIERERKSRSMTVLSATHLTDEADRAERVILMHQGIVVADAPPQTLRSELGLRRVTVTDPDFASHAAQSDAWQRHDDAHWTRALDPERAPEILGPLIAEGICFAVAPPSLADVFLARTGARLDAPPAAEPEHAA